MGNIHVANGSQKFLRVRAAQERVVISDIEASGGISGGGSIALNGSIKTSLDRKLDTTGFARLGPGDALEFDVDIDEGDVYVTITTADDPEPYVIAYNYVPPEGRSIIVTDQLTLQLSQKLGSVWKTDYGVCYDPRNAACVQKQNLRNSEKNGSGGPANEKCKSNIEPVEDNNGARKDEVPVTSSNSCCVIM